MTDINFIELAEYCQNRYKEENTSNDVKYISTLFVAITKDGEVLPSKTPHILRNAEQCILFHISSYKNNNYWWSSYKFQFISNDGVVSDYQLDDKFALLYQRCFSVLQRKQYFFSSQTLGKWYS